MLSVFETHPVQYHAPVYRRVAELLGGDIHVVYGSDYSVVGGEDREFGNSYAWDVDLLSGYSHEFLGQVKKGGAKSYSHISSDGLEDAFERNSPDVVMILGYRHPFDRTVFKIARKRRVPILFRGEVTDHAFRRNIALSWIRDVYLKNLYTQCGGLLYIGWRARQHYLRLGQAESKMFFSPYCDDLKVPEIFMGHPDPKKHARQILGVGPQDFVFLFSGKLVSRKGVSLIVQAAKSMKPESRNRSLFLFVGDGAEKDSLICAASDTPVVRAHFAGFKNQSEMGVYYAAADCLVLPSRSGETWGVVVNEAIRCGLKIIVSDGVGCAPDLAADKSYARVFRSGSPDELASCLEWAVEGGLLDDARSEQIEILKRYSVAAAASGVVEAYKQLFVKKG